jgi:hypothetical protein
MSLTRSPERPIDKSEQSRWSKSVCVFLCKKSANAVPCNRSSRCHGARPRVMKQGVCVDHLSRNSLPVQLHHQQEEWTMHYPSVQPYQLLGHCASITRREDSRLSFDNYPISFSSHTTRGRAGSVQGLCRGRRVSCPESSLCEVTTLQCGLRLKTGPAQSYPQRRPHPTRLVISVGSFRGLPPYIGVR